MPRRILRGEVVSCKMDKTAVVRVKRPSKHPIYKKVVFKFRKYAAHDPDNACSVGDVVSIRESRPYSKTKTWEVVHPALSEKEVASS